MRFSKKRLTSSIIALVLIFSLLFSLTSCNPFVITADPPVSDDDPSTDDTPKNIYVQGGDTNNITINASGDTAQIAAAKAVLSVVSVYSEFEATVSNGWGGSKTQSFSTAGAGVIYKLDKDNGDAYIITNYHVIYHSSDNSHSKIARKITLYLYGMESNQYAIEAQFLGGSMQYDIAVLKVTGSEVLMSSLATAATVADSNDVSILETAIAVGNPEKDGISATSGYVNVDSETIDIYAADDLTLISIRVMRIDAAINGGNSGGGVFNSRGELIGIVNAKKTLSDGMGYAIPSNVAKYLADNIIYYCDGNNYTSVMRCILGIKVTPSSLYTEYDEQTGRVYKREYVKVSSVEAGSIAKLKVGDVIEAITIDGVQYEVTRSFHVIDAMLNARVGSKVTFKIRRKTIPYNISLTITSDTVEAYR